MFILASIVALCIASSVEAEYPTLSMNEIAQVQAAMNWDGISKEDIMNAESGPILNALKYNIAKHFLKRGTLPAKSHLYTDKLKRELPALFGYGTLAGNAAGAFKAILDLVNSGYPANKVLIIYGLRYSAGKEWRLNPFYKLLRPVLKTLETAGVKVYRFTTVNDMDDPAGMEAGEKTCNKNTTSELIKEFAKHGLITLDCWTGTGFIELEKQEDIDKMLVSTLGLNTINDDLHVLETVAETSAPKIINLSNDIFSGMFANTGVFSKHVPSGLKFEGLFSAYISKEFVNIEAAPQMTNTAVHVMLTNIKGDNGKNFYETAIVLFKNDSKVVKVMQDYIDYITAGKTFVVHKANSSGIEAIK